MNGILAKGLLGETIFVQVWKQVKQKNVIKTGVYFDNCTHELLGNSVLTILSHQ